MKRTPLRDSRPVLAQPPAWLVRAFQTAARHFQAGLFDQARQLLILILEREPRHADSMYLLASIAAQSGDIDLAESLLKQAIAIEPRQPLYWVLLGNVLQHRDQLEASAVCYQQAIAIDANSFDAYYNWGNTLERQGRSRDATAAFEKTIALHPQHIQARNNLANQYRQQGRLEEAARILEQLRQEDPAAMPIALNLGNVYMAQDRHTQALECFDQAVALAPQAGVAYNNRGNCLRTLKRLGEAVQSYREAIFREPNRPDYFVNLGVGLQSQGRLPEAMEAFGHALRLEPENAAAHSSALFTLHYDSALSDRDLAAAHVQWAERHAAPLAPGPRSFRQNKDPEKRLRVGYVSADFRQHPVALFTAPVLEAHSAEVESICYAASMRSDAWTARLRKAAGQWREAGGLSDAELAAQIEQDGVDILVDLAGHTAANRLLAFARRPAPVAITWLGYFNTTGMKAIDYLIADSILAPEGEPSPFVENVLRLDGCYLSFAGPDYAPDPAPPPCLARGHITYGCFNTLTKITDPVIKLWSRLLMLDPEARLVLRNPILDDPLSRQLCLENFARHGIAANRIEFGGSEAHRDLLTRYAEVDVALDPFPYNGGTTTCEALWMGVPVVSRRGSRFVSRVGATVLHHAGCGEWIAETPDEYLECALALGRDRDQLAATRAGLRGRVRGSVLGDTAGFTRRLENAFRNAWRTWCAESH